MSKDRLPKNVTEEIRRMRIDGDKKRRENGTLVDLTAEKAGGGLGKQDRKYLQDHIAIATASLAEGQFDGWYESLMEIRNTLHKKDWQDEHFVKICQGVEGVAIKICGDPNIGAIGRTHIQKKRENLFYGPMQ